MFCFVFYLFIYGCVGSSFLCEGFSCVKRGPLLIAVLGPLTIAASLVGSTGFRRAGSVVVANGPSCSAACGIFPDQGSNPCPLHWQADSQSQRHQGSLVMSFHSGSITGKSQWLSSCFSFSFSIALSLYFTLCKQNNIKDQYKVP